MTAVKGSQQYKMKVVPYRPYYRLAVWSGIWCTVVAILIGAYYLGHGQGTGLQAKAVSERDSLREELSAKKSEAESLRQQVANLNLGSTVDRKASESVRNEVIQLKEKIAALEENISFYRGLMAPTANKRGLTIGSLDVISTGVPRHYQYALVIQQLATSHQMLTGYVNFNVVGRKPGLAGQPMEVVSIPLKELSSSVSFENVKLRFKYFQSLRGELVLPEGFEPERIELLAKSAGKNSVTVEKKFGWLVQEK